jgi:alpha-L-fucosidase
MNEKAGGGPGCGREERMAWWHEAKFGMFVHWGCYSVPGRGEQVLLRDFMPLEEYMGLAGQFPWLDGEYRAEPES